MTDLRPRHSYAPYVDVTPSSGPGTPSDSTDGLGAVPLSADEPSTDTQLLERVRGGEVGCYAELYHRHVDAAQRQARRAGALEDPEDVAQEAFVKILRAVQDGGGPREGFVAYLMRVVRNEAIDRLRRYRETAVADLEEDSCHAPLVEDGTGERAERELLTRALGSLSHDHQELLWSTVVEGRSPRDLAPDLHVSANVVAQRASRAREALRTAWLQEQVDVTSGEEDCRQVATLLGAFARGRLGARRAAEVEEHLEHCPRCTRALEELEALSVRMRSALLPVVLASPLLLEQAASRSSARALPLTRPIVARVLGGAAPRFALAGAGAAVVLGTVVTGAVLFPWTGEGEAVQDHVAGTSAPGQPVPSATATEGTADGTADGTVADDPAGTPADPAADGGGTAGTVTDGPAANGAGDGTPIPPADGAAVTVNSSADGSADGAVASPAVDPQRSPESTAPAPDPADGTPGTDDPSAPGTPPIRPSPPHRPGLPLRGTQPPTAPVEDPVEDPGAEDPATEDPLPVEGPAGEDDATVEQETERKNAPRPTPPMLHRPGLPVSPLPPSSRPTAPPAPPTDPAAPPTSAPVTVAPAIGSPSPAEEDPAPSTGTRRDGAGNGG